MKRAVTKKLEPEPKPKPVKKVKPKKYGFEDLPDDVKNVISKNVKNNIDTKYTKENLKPLKKNVLNFLIVDGHGDLFNEHIHESIGMEWYKYTKQDMIEYILEPTQGGRYTFNKKYFDEEQMIKEGNLPEKKSKTKKT